MISNLDNIPHILRDWRATSFELQLQQNFNLFIKILTFIFKEKPENDGRVIKRSTFKLPSLPPFLLPQETKFVREILES